MDTLHWILFESLPVLGFCLFVVLFVLLVRWRSGGTARPFLIGFVVAIGLLIMQSVVVTQREHAGNIMRSIEQGLLAGDAQPVIDALAPTFRSEQMDDAAFADFAEAQLRRVRVLRLYQLENRLEASEDERFTSRLVYISEVETQNGGATFNSVWDITFGWFEDAYRIVDIRPIRIGQHDMQNWNDLRRVR